MEEYKIMVDLMCLKGMLKKSNWGMKWDVGILFFRLPKDHGAHC